MRCYCDSIYHPNGECQNPRGTNAEFWYCKACNAQNHVSDGECQYCECDGKQCKRDNCSDPAHLA